MISALRSLPMNVEKLFFLLCVVLPSASIAQDPTHTNPPQPPPPKSARTQTEATKNCLDDNSFINNYGPPGVLLGQPTSLYDARGSTLPTSSSLDQSSLPHLKLIRPHSVLRIQTWGTSETKYNATYGVPGVSPSYELFTHRGLVHTAALDSDFRRGMADAFLCNLMSADKKRNLELFEQYLKDNDKRLNQYTNFGSDQVNEYGGRCEGQAKKQAKERAKNAAMLKMVQDIKKLQEDNKDNSDILDFLYAVFYQSKVNEQDLGAINPKLKITPALKDQVDKVIGLKGKQELTAKEQSFLKFFDEFTGGPNQPRFQYLVHPIIGSLISDAIATSNSPVNLADNNHLETARKKIAETLGVDPKSLTGSPSSLAGKITLEEDSITPVIAWAYRHFLDRKDNGASDPGRQVWIEKIKKGELDRWQAVEQIKNSEEARAIYNKPGTPTNRDGIISAYELLLGRPAGDDAQGWIDRANREGSGALPKLAKQIFESDEGTRHLCNKLTAGGISISEDPILSVASRQMEQLRAQQADDPERGPVFDQARNNLLENLAEHAPHGLWNTPEGARLRRLSQRALQQQNPNPAEVASTVDRFAQVNPRLLNSLSAQAKLAKSLGIPYQAEAAEPISKLDPLYVELLNHLSSKKVSLNADQKAALGQYLEKGQPDKLMEALFNEKNTSLFRATAEFITATNPEFKSFLDEMSGHIFMSKKASEDYSELRANLRNSFSSKNLSDLTAEEKKKLFGLMLLDEWGLKGVTSRDKSVLTPSDSGRILSDYDLNFYLSSLKKENELLSKICGEDESCKKKTDRELLDKAKNFISNYTGIPPNLRQILLERKLAEPHLKTLKDISDRFSRGEYDNSEEKFAQADEAYNKAAQRLQELGLSQLSQDAEGFLKRVNSLYSPAAPQRQQHYFAPITRERVANYSQGQVQLPGSASKPELTLRRDQNGRDSEYEAHLSRYVQMNPAQQEQVKKALEARKKQREINYDLVRKIKPQVMRVASYTSGDQGIELKGLLTALSFVSPDTNSDLGLLLTNYGSYNPGSKERKDLAEYIAKEVSKILVENQVLPAGSPQFKISTTALDSLFNQYGSSQPSFEGERKLFDQKENEQKNIAQTLSTDLKIPLDRVQRLLAIQDEIQRAKEHQSLPLSLSSDPKAAKEGFEASLFNHLRGAKQLDYSDITPEVRDRLMPTMATPQPASEELKKAIEELRKMGIEYEPVYNELTLQPWAQLGNKEKILELLRKLPPVAFRIQVEGGAYITLPRRNAVQAFEDAMLRRAAAFNIGPIVSNHDFGTGGFNNQNSAEKYRHKWFPLSSKMAARIMMVKQPDGSEKLSYEFKPVEELQRELQSSLSTIHQLRAEIARNDKDTRSLWRAWRLIGDEMLKLPLSWVDPELAKELDANNSEEKIESRRLDRALLNLENFIKGAGTITFKDSSMSAEHYATTQVRGLRSLKNQQEIDALDQQTKNILNIRDGVLMVATLPFGGPITTTGKSGWSLWAANVLNKSFTVGRFGRGTAVTLNDLRIVKGLSAIAKTGNVAQRVAANSSLVLLRSVGMIPGSVRHGMATAATFQGIGAGVKTSVELWRIQYGEEYIQSRLAEAEKNPTGWKKYRKHPDEMATFKNRESDPKVQEAYEKAVHEFNIEQQLDVNGDGYIDMLREETRDIGYTNDISTRLSNSVFNPEELNRFIGSAQFFTNLHLMGHATGPLGTRFSAGKPILEMPLAATMGNLQNYFFRPEAWKERRAALEQKAQMEGKTYQPSGAGELWDAISEDLVSNLEAGAVFSAAIGANNRFMGSVLGLQKPGFGNQLKGTAGFMATDMALKEAAHWMRHGRSQFSGMSSEQLGESLLDHLSTAAYIGWGSSRGYLNRAQFNQQKESLLGNGVEKYREKAQKEFEDNYKKANKKESLSEADQKEINEGVNYHIEGLLRSLEPEDYKKADKIFIEDLVKWRNEKFEKANKALAELKTSTQNNTEVNKAIVEMEKSHTELQRLINEGAWNKVTEIRKALDSIDAQTEKIQNHMAQIRKELDAKDLERRQALRNKKPLSETAEQEILNKEMELFLLSQQMLQATRAVTQMREFSGSLERVAAVLGKDSESAFRAQFGAEGVDLSEAHKAIERQKGKRGFVNPAIKWLSENGVVDLTPDAFGRRGYGNGMLSNPTGLGAANFSTVHRSAVDTVVNAYRDRASTPAARQQLVRVLESLSASEAVKLAETEYKKASGELKQVWEGVLQRNAPEKLTPPSGNPPP